MFGQIFGAIGDGFATISNEVNKSVAGIFADRITKTVESGNVDALKNPITAAVALNPLNAPIDTVTMPIAAQTEKAVETVTNTVSGAVDGVKKYLPAVAVGALGLLLLSKR